MKKDNITVTFSSIMLEEIAEIVKDCKDCSLGYNISIYNNGKSTIHEYTPNYKGCIAKHIDITSSGYITVIMRNGITLYGTDTPDADGLFNVTGVRVRA